MTDKGIFRVESNQSTYQPQEATVRCPSLTFTICYLFYFESSSTFCIKTISLPRWLPKFQTTLRLGDSYFSESSQNKDAQYSFISVCKCLFMCVFPGYGSLRWEASRR